MPRDALIDNLIGMCAFVGRAQEFPCRQTVRLRVEYCTVCEAAERLREQAQAARPARERGESSRQQEAKNLPDDRLREMWRSVTGPYAELTGPLIRFAGLVYNAARAGDSSEDLVDSLHHIFTKHGIASRSDLSHTLISDIVSWAARKCREATRERGEQAAAPQWQPIETAPENARMLVWLPNWPKATVLSRGSRERGNADKWFDDDGYQMSRPTHWMPLPEPPNALPPPPARAEQEDV